MHNCLLLLFTGILLRCAPKYTSEYVAKMPEGYDGYKYEQNYYVAEFCSRYAFAVARTSNEIITNQGGWRKAATS